MWYGVLTALVRVSGTATRPLPACTLSTGKQVNAQAKTLQVFEEGIPSHLSLPPQLFLSPSISPFCSSLRVTSTSHYPPQSPSHRCDQNKNLPFSFSKLSKCSCERLSPDTHTSTTHKPTSPGYTMAAVLFTRHDLWSAPGKSFVLIVPVFRQLHTALRV